MSINVRQVVFGVIIGIAIMLVTMAFSDWQFRDSHLSTDIPEDCIVITNDDGSKNIVSKLDYENADKKYQELNFQS